MHVHTQVNLRERGREHKPKNPETLRSKRKMGRKGQI